MKNFFQIIAMPDKCQYCGEHAVIEESVDGGKEQLICIECGSLATGPTSRSCGDQLNYEEADDTITNSQVDEEDCDAICRSCGGDIHNETLCLACSQENLTNKNELTDDNLESDSENDIESTHLGGEKSSNEIKCISCSSKNLSTESINGDERLICTDCGSVNSNSVLTADEFLPLTRTKDNNLRTLPRFHEGARIVKGLEAGVTEIHLLCSKYHFSFDVKKEAEEMYRKLFYHADVKNLTIIRKQNIGVACVFIVCRKHNLPVTLTQFKDDVNVFKTFLEATRLVLKVLDVQLPHMSVTSLLTSFLNEIGFHSKIAGKVKDILFLYRKAWLSEGRSRKSLITIATYYAYLSSDRCEEFIPISQFCQQFKIPSPGPNLVRECKALLRKLAQSLPWVAKGRVTDKNISFYISDIIKYQESLFHLVFQSDYEDNAGLQYKCQSVEKGEQDVKQDVKPGSKRKEALKPTAFKKIHLIRQESIQSTVPPGINLDSAELKETEFEEEIDSYILSPEEQAHVEKHKMSFWKS